MDVTLTQIYALASRLQWRKLQAPAARLAFCAARLGHRRRVSGPLAPRDGDVVSWGPRGPLFIDNGGSIVRAPRRPPRPPARPVFKGAIGVGLDPLVGGEGGGRGEGGG